MKLSQCEQDFVKRHFIRHFKSLICEARAYALQSNGSATLNLLNKVRQGKIDFLFFNCFTQNNNENSLAIPLDVKT